MVQKLFLMTFKDHKSFAVKVAVNFVIPIVFDELDNFASFPVERCWDTS